MRKPSQKQLQNQLISAYNKAYKVYSDLNKAGFNFTKTHEKVMSFERLTKKLTSGKITKKDVQFYKDKAKKTIQYKGAKSYTDMDTGKTMSVKQGRLSERRKNKRKKDENSYNIITNQINNIADDMFLIDRTSKLGININTTSDKERLLQIVEDRRQNNKPFTNREMSDFMSTIADVDFIRYVDEYEKVVDRLALTINGTGKIINSDFGYIDPTGTPFEN